ncbi:2'-5' RNA ligase [Mycolicibacterium sp. BK556]|uniref:2'-5' RNA ligase family protein n=1 Tax=Mycobacteriaceae TaxID=1762 RepID=UPI00105F65A3|nr:MULTISPECIES: 2'-5' RNA ligase family protein [Mycobacteriaceae]MBB3606769.1 2'-5' RNA ligase [Mycolicibacterium sp. BK556]MBB3636565.1 2'-5' RNA ligase [Mycolicibacterium sp. BK607]MBB3754348.1 2'-5' RNA ligase [Mycolicibacterium sp. BK634]TDO17005.1 2'-5' RNA ligase [Mycobacterium sp. BK086]
MAHSIELLLDERADTAIRQMWRELGVRSATTHRPHITLIAAERISPDVDRVLAGLVGNFPLPVVLGAPLTFGSDRLTLARLVVPSAALLALHQEIYNLCGPFVSTLFAHSSPGRWTPHVTLARRFTAAQVGEALAAVDGIAADIRASSIGLRRWDGDAKRDYLIS